MAVMDAGWQYLGGLARRLRWTIVGAVAAGLAWQAAAIGAPLLVRYGIDAGIVRGGNRALWLACLGIAVLGLAEAIGGALRHYFAIRNRAKADADVRDGIFRRALELDARYHDRVGAGELISRASNDAELIARVYDSIGHTIGYVLTIVGASIVLFVVDWHLVLSGDITVGTFALFSFYLALLVNPLRTIGQRVSAAQRGVAAARRVVEVLQAEPAVVESATPKPFPERADVRFESVTFAYHGDERPILEGFSLEIPAGTSLALVGATGSGKSTAAALLARFYDPDEGHDEIGGIDVRELKLTDLRRGVGLVFEETFLFGDTVAGNVGFAVPGADEQDVQRAAQLAGAADFVEDLPEGYETILGERGFSLSGGQRQRIAIARAILADPQVLILDDATSAVDATKEHEIRSALAEVMRGRTTLVIAHRPATIALADRVAVVDEGRVVEQGTHGELLARSAHYRELLALAQEEAA